LSSTIVRVRRTCARALAVVSGAAVVLVCACSSHDDATTSSEALLSSEHSSNAAALFSSATKRVVLEIDYQPGAAPFVGPTETFRDPWTIFRDNARALLGSSTEIVVPTRLADMERLDDVVGRDFSRLDLLAIADKHRSTVTSDDTVAFYVVFLAGRFKDDDDVTLPQTAGVSVRGTGVIGMFKPAITAGFTEPMTPAFMEQATLVHEFGHAVGLVDDGISPTSAHRDLKNGAHCKNSACIMYFENVLVKDGVDFVDTYLKPQKNILFGSECLTDVRTFAALRGRVGTF
jgi:hypothetical protein